MKSGFTVIAILIQLNLGAQPKPEKLHFNLGGEFIIPANSSYKTSVGITGQALYPFNKNLAVSLHSGVLGFYSSVRASDGFYRMRNTTLIPILGGCKYRISEQVYAHGQVGMALLNQGLGNHFCFGAALGWYATPHLDFSAGFNSYKAQGTAASIEWFALRSSYTF